jgi:exodeoxyribonuclease VII large subunit
LRREVADIAADRDRVTARIGAALTAARADLEHLRARVRALSPQATLDRGYAVVRRADGQVVRAPAQAVGDLRIRVAQGEFAAFPK